MLPISSRAMLSAGIKRKTVGRGALINNPRSSAASATFEDIASCEFLKIRRALAG
jgi:hypothetical protein